MDAQELIVLLSVLLLNNLLQSDFMLDFVERTLNMSMDMGLATDKQLENKISMSTLHSVVLIILVASGFAGYIGVFTKAVYKGSK